MKTKLVLLLLLLSNAVLFAQRDTEFWFVAPEASKHNNGQDRPIYLRVAAYDQPTNITVTVPANAGFVPITASLSAFESRTIELIDPPFYNIGDYENEYSLTPGNFGLHITGTNDFSVYYDIEAAGCNFCSPEFFSLKGRNALGTRFRIPMQKKYHRASAYNNPECYGAFDIVATEETDITVTHSVALRDHPLPIGGGNGVIHQHLMPGQTISYATIAGNFTAGNNPSGTLVESTKPIAVTVKDDKVDITDDNGTIGVPGDDGTGQDLLGDQLIPEHLLGTEYIAVSVSFSDIVTVVATENNTEVKLDGVTQPTLMQAGESRDIGILPTINNAGHYIWADKKIYVFQTTGRAGEAGGALLPPVNCTGSREVSVIRANPRELNIVLVTQQANIGAFELSVNGVVQTSYITAAMFHSVPTGTWQYAIINIPTSVAIAEDAIRVSNTLGVFHMGLFNGITSQSTSSSTGGSAYGYFSDFSGISLDVTSTSCVGNCDGAIVVTASEAISSGSLSYAWSGGPPNWTAPTTAASVSGLCEGSYTVVVTSSNGCTVEGNVQVSGPAVADAYLIQEGCARSETVSLSVLGLDNPEDFTFLWSNGATTSSISGLSAGTYSVTITDGNGCSVTRSLNVKNFTVNTIMNYADRLTCDGACNGEIDVWHQFGGVAPFTYQWNKDGVPFSTTGAISNLCEGTYTVTVTDANECTASASRGLSRPDPVSVTPTVIDATCEGNDGSITLAVAGGVPLAFPGSSGYQYLWSNGATTSSLSNLAPGTYTVTVSTADHCSGTATITVGGSAPLIGNISISPNPICVGQEAYLQVNLGGTGTGFAQFIFDGMIDPVFDYPAPLNINQLLTTGPADIGIHEVCLVLYDVDPRINNDYCSKTMCITGEVKSCGCDLMEGNAEIKAIAGVDMKYAFNNIGTIEATYLNWFVDGVLIAQTPGNGTFNYQFSPGQHTVCMDASYILTNEDGTTTCCVVRDCIDIEIDLCDYLKSTDGLSFTVDPNNYHNIIFTVTASTNPVVPTIVWNFGDGTVEVTTNQVVTHHYTDNNNGLGYQACATIIWTRNGTVFDPNADDLEVCCCVDEICLPVEIAPCNAITLDIVMLEEVGQSATFQVLPSAPVSPVTYEWSVDQIVLASGPSVYYSYPVTPVDPYTLCVEAKYSTNFPNEPSVVCKVEQCEYFKRTYPSGGGQQLLRYYPNPTNGMITVEVKANENDIAKLELANNMGQPLLVKEFIGLKEGDNQLYLNIREFSSGLYLMKVAINQEMQVVKVIKE